MVSPRVCVEIDAAFSVQSVTGDLALVFGINPEALLTGTSGLQAALHPSDKAILTRALDDDTLSGISREAHLRIRDDAGRYRVAVADIRRRKDVDGRVTLLVQLFDPRAMAASPKGLPNPMVAAIMETTDDYIFFKDTHHILLAASQSMVGLCQPITHWTQFPAKSDYDVFPELLADEYYELETRVYSEKAMAQELQPMMH